MDEPQQSPDSGAPAYGSASGQHPHVPGHDPLGSGMPRLPEPLQAFAAATTDGGDEDAPAPEEDAPLGGDENTEQQLSADTAVETDALKALDPDDTPA